MAITRVLKVLAPAESYDLTDLEAVRDELALTAADDSRDRFLSRAISAASRAIAKHCNREFVPEKVSDQIYYDSTQLTLAPLQLSRFPVIDLSSVSAAGAALTADADFLLDVKAGTLTHVMSDGTSAVWSSPGVTVAEYIAGFGSLVVNAAEIPAYPDAPSIAIDPPIAFDMGVTFDNDTALTRVTATQPAQGTYSIASGYYVFSDADDGQGVTISYAAKVIPDDVIEATLRLVTMRFHNRGRNPNLMSQSGPDPADNQRFWVTQDEFPPEVEGLLAAYVIPAFA